MKYFHTTTYYLKGNNKFNICILSDIHFSKQVNNNNLKKIKNYLLKLNPTYIFIAGDLLDILDKIKDKKEKNRLINWLTEISGISKVILIRGNHDMVRRDKRKLKEDKRNKFFESLNKISNIYYLDDSKYEDDNIYVCGLKQTLEYYKTGDYNLLKEILIKNKKLLNKKTDKMKFLLIHSPIGIENDDPLLKNIDYVITGHMHNGCVPPIINELWKSTKGFVSPAKHLLTKNERNTLNKETDKLLVNGPVTTLSSCTKIKILDFIFPLYNTVFEFDKQNEFKKQKRYHLK